MAKTIKKQAKRTTRRAKTNKELTILGSALRTLGGLGGAAAGSLFGMGPAGSATGTSIGAALSKWLGAGDYALSSNSIVSKARSSDSVAMMHHGGQSIIVRHREFLGSILGSVNYHVAGTFDLNPGREETFPWLSQIARRFQEYSFKGVVFHYVPTSGSISSTQALGSVMMQTSYRSTDAAPVSKVEMLNEYWSCETVPFETLAHPIECDPKENPFNVQYVRTGNVPSGESKLSYDLGITTIATQGQSVDNVALGDLWVTYEVELKKPVLYSNVSSTNAYLANRYTGGNSGNFFSGTLAGTTGSLDVTFSVKQITMPRGMVGSLTIICVLASNAGLTDASAWTADPTLTNCTLIDTFYDGGAWGNIASATTAALNMFYMCTVTKVDIDAVATIILPDATIASGTIDFIEVRCSLTEPVA
jgi:hypothetical protein